MADTLARLRELNAEIDSRDPDLAQEVQAKRTSAESQVNFETEARIADPEVLESADALEAQGAMELESIIFFTKRPVLDIKHDVAELTFADAESEVWRARLQTASDRMAHAARAIGRIELEGHDEFAWVGTGWLVDRDVVVTNRHVALTFSQRSGDRFVFRPGWDRPHIDASIDFVEEFDNPLESPFVLKQVLYIEEVGDGPDLAFLRAEAAPGKVLADPIALSTKTKPDGFVAAIGYPARDPRIPDPVQMDRIFSGRYDKKRLAPGEILGVAPAALRHDCSTLGGNSGSAIVALSTGEAVGLHFGGTFLTANRAVPSVAIRERLDAVLSGRPIRLPRPSQPEPRPESPPPTVAVAAPSTTGVTYVIPLRVTLDVGAPQIETTTVTVSPSGGPGAAAEQTTFSDEIPVEQLAGRQGYVDTFLGTGDFKVALPRVTKDKADILTFGDNEHVLKYEHFSVVMSKSRRMCRFSAVNIDGTQEKLGLTRPGWRRDGRIGKNEQILDECYGNAPKFARGHMTRREDPIWGDDESAANGNADSMHVTNVCPQMQTFNAGTWLDLESYALDNARDDDMKVSVFTGPFSTPDDITRNGVRIPAEYWKIIAFIHDDTGKLCATGYTQSQKDHITETELVFGEFETYQHRIADIQSRTGLSFGRLAKVDAFVEREGLGAQPIRGANDIVYTAGA
ncbi:MAG: non-specific endonuclease [Mycobacterium sp.]|nr:non-specific endonuclease [Mycobacterium sp.]